MIVAARLGRSLQGFVTARIHDTSKRLVAVKFKGYFSSKMKYFRKTLDNVIKKVILYMRNPMIII